MRSRVAALFTLLLSYGCVGCNEILTEDKPIEKTDKIQFDDAYTAADFNDELMSIVDGSYGAVNKVLLSDSSNIKDLKEDLLFEIEINKSRIQKINFQEDGDALKEAVQAFLNFYQEQFSQQFKEIETIIMQGDWTDADDKLLKSFDNDFAKKEAEFIKKIQDEQTEFATKHKIQLVDRAL